MDNNELLETLAVIEEMDQVIASLESDGEIELDLLEEGDGTND